MKLFCAILALAVLGACQTESEYDGVSRFAGSTSAFDIPESPSKDAPPAPELPGPGGDFSSGVTPNTVTPG